LFDQVLITKRFLSQLYGRSPDSTPTDLERKVELSTQLVAIASVLDPGLSQFRGLSLYDLFLGRLGLALAAEGAAEPEGLSAAVRAELRSLLEECISCLSVEISASHAGRVATSAATYLTRLTS
jgi:hypothetical protein